MTKEELEKELFEIQSFLEYKFQYELDSMPNIRESLTYIEARGNILNQHMARSGELLAEAKYLQDSAVVDSVVEQLSNLTNLKPMAQRKFLDSIPKDFNRLVNKAERVNNTCGRQLDWLRSLLSKQKEELKQLQFNR